MIDSMIYHLLWFHFLSNRSMLLMPFFPWQPVSPTPLRFNIHRNKKNQNPEPKKKKVIPDTVKQVQPLQRIHLPSPAEGHPKPSSSAPCGTAAGSGGIIQKITETILHMQSQVPVLRAPRSAGISLKTVALQLKYKKLLQAEEKPAQQKAVTFHEAAWHAPGCSPSLTPCSKARAVPLLPEGSWAEDPRKGWPKQHQHRNACSESSIPSPLHPACLSPRPTKDGDSAPVPPWNKELSGKTAEQSPKQCGSAGDGGGGAIDAELCGAEPVLAVCQGRGWMQKDKHPNLGGGGLDFLPPPCHNITAPEAGVGHRG